MASKIESVVDGGMDVEKALHGSGRLELELSPNFGDGLRVQAATVRD